MSKEQQTSDKNRHHEESNDNTVWYPRTDLTEGQIWELQNMLEFVKEGIVKVNMMILTSSVLWQSCTWNSHQESMDAMLECARIHFLEVTNVFLEYLRIAYRPPCFTTTGSGVAFGEEPPVYET